MLLLCWFFWVSFSPSFVGESLLSLLLFRLMVMSMGSIDVVAGDDVDDCIVAVVDVDDYVLAVISVGAAMVTVVESFVVVVSLVLFSVGASIGFFKGVFPPFFSCNLGLPFLVFIVGVFLVIFDIFGGCLCCYDLMSSSSGSSRCCWGGRCFLRAVFCEISNFVASPT